jgi:hypothetical protein
MQSFRNDAASAGGVVMRTNCVAVVVLLTVSFAMPAWAACDKDMIDTISEDGDLIVLSSGTTYDVAEDDQSKAAGWQEGDDVLVCGHTMIDKNQGGKVRVSAH